LILVGYHRIIGGTASPWKQPDKPVQGRTSIPELQYRCRRDAPVTSCPAKNQPASITDSQAAALYSISTHIGRRHRGRRQGCGSSG
jgi:hypothetical protein